MTRTAGNTHLIHKDESYAIIGACLAVYKDKGCGFLEPVYHECLEIEFESQQIPFLSKAPQTLQYRSRTLVQTFAPDFTCYGKVIVEIKGELESGKRPGVISKALDKLADLLSPAGGNNPDFYYYYPMY